MSLLKKQSTTVEEELSEYPFEIVVKYRASESQVYEPLHPQLAKTAETRDHQDDNGTFRSTTESIYPEKSFTKPRSVLYPCYSYSVAEGALFIGADMDSKAGFFIPLDVILEVEFIDNRTPEQIEQANQMAAQAVQH